ncbi:MAG: ATP-binding protein [Streptosporangiales bacterium]|jgi:anti-sigma regulatory factor (Ser/Thr protein kinase)|nr:ATP-binding protein [Streptosporangiales bacterium]
MAIRPTQESPSPPRDHRAQLPADPRAASEARRQVRAAVRYWRLPVDLDVAALLVSELVTNAVTHDERAPDGPRRVTLAIRGSGGRLRVDVHDASPEPPVLTGASDCAEGGRGLFLVDSLADSWGSYRTADGKAVFFIL